MADSKEEARMKLKADANFQRNLRYKDHRLRTIGINLDGLNQQVAEKKRMQEDEREQERQESKSCSHSSLSSSVFIHLLRLEIRNDEIESVLDSIEQEEKRLRAMQAAELRKQWDDQSSTKKFQQTQGRMKEIADFHQDPSMTFAGEDKQHAQRRREQQEQVRRWTQEDLELKAYNEAKLREEDQARAELNRAVDQYRAGQEQDEANMRKELTRRILEENQAVSVSLLLLSSVRPLTSAQAAAARAQAARDAKAADGRDLNNSISFNGDTSLDENGYCRTKDAFRGYSKGQMKQMLLENEDLIRQKRSALLSVPPLPPSPCPPLRCSLLPQRS
jgi:hypothetical protein